MIPVATPTLRDSVASSVAAKPGMVKRESVSISISRVIPLPSFPMTINPFVANGVVYMFLPSKNVPKMENVSDFSSWIASDSSK